jgi:ketosteroid isomerase-like protein
VSQENIDLVTAMTAAYNAGDIEAWLGFFAPDFEMIPDKSLFPDSWPVHGIDEWRRWVADTRSTLTNEHWEQVDVRAVGADRVLMREVWTGKGVASGADVAANVSLVCTIRDGRVSKMEYFLDHQEAVKAAGLEE